MNDSTPTTEEAPHHAAGETPAVSLPPAHLAALTELSKQPYDASELFRLHQFYFSPPPSTSAANNAASKQQRHQQYQHAAAASPLSVVRSAPRVDSEEYLQPCKRQCNNLTKTRIAYYPRLKVRITYTA